MAAKVLEKGTLVGQREVAHVDDVKPVTSPDTTNGDESAVDEVTLILERKAIRPQPQAAAASITTVGNDTDSERKKEE